MIFAWDAKSLSGHSYCNSKWKESGFVVMWQWISTWRENSPDRKSRMILERRERNRDRYLRLKGVESARPFIGPATVEFHITDLCNLACQYCWYYGWAFLILRLERISAFWCIWEHYQGLPWPFRWYDFSVRHGRAKHASRFFTICSPVLSDLLIWFTPTGLSTCALPDILRADHIVINLAEADREVTGLLQGRDLLWRWLEYQGIGQLKLNLIKILYWNCVYRHRLKYG